MRTTFTCLFLVFVLPFSNCYKILGVFPHPGKSHFNFFEPLMKELARIGHEVTVISHFPQETPIKGYTDISIVDETHTEYNVINITYYTASRWRRYLNSYLLAELGWMSCNNGFSHKAFQDFIRSRPKFDVILMEYFNTDCYLALAHILKAPLIGLSSCVIMPWLHTQLGIPDNPGYIPIPYIKVSDKMTFFERLENSFLYIFTAMIYKFYIEIPSNRAVKKYLGNDIPPLSDIAANTSLVLANMHFTLTSPRNLPPGFIEVSGLNIGKPKKLPQNIEKWINESKQGVIYFSLGSMVQVNSLPDRVRNIFFKVLARMPQRIICKWELEHMIGQPKNVMIQKWLPQLDILCHPNVKAYLTHSGMLGTAEAINCGVPMVMLPQFGDQFTNAKTLEQAKGGITLDMWSMSEEDLEKAIKTVLTPTYQDRAKELSARYRDRPLSPMDTAIYWVEYVVKHKGAHYMKTAAATMSFYQYFLIDIILFVLLVLVLLYFIINLIAKTVCKMKNFKTIQQSKKRN